MPSDAVFNKGMAILGAAYPDYECSPATVDIYRERLQKLSDLDFERAVYHHIDTCKWFPKVSELLQASRAHQPTPIDVWNRLLRAAEAGQEPELTGPEAAALSAIGGWETFQITSFDDLHFRFKDFRVALLEVRARENLALAGSEQKAVEG